MQTIITYYKSLSKTEKRNFINTVSNDCGISEASLLAKINGKRSFKKLEKEKIAFLLSADTDVLFPEPAFQKN